MGRRKTMICANILTIGAAAVTLLAVYLGSLPLCIAGLCLTGMSYGACPTVIFKWNPISSKYFYSQTIKNRAAAHIKFGDSPIF